MAISIVGWAAGANTATMPAHAVDDCIVVFAFRDGSTTLPTGVAGFTAINGSGTNVCSNRLAYRRALTTSEVVGTWTNATTVIVVVLRGVDWTQPIGGQATTGAASTTISYPALTMSRTDGTSLVLAFGGHCSTNVAIETVPSAMTLIGTASDATDEAAAFSLAGATAFAAKTAAVGGASSGWRSATVEIRAAPAVGYTLTALGASLALIGGSADLRVSRRLTGGGSGLSLTAGSAALRRGYVLAAVGAGLTLTSSTAALRVSRRLVASGQALVLTPGLASLRRGFRLAGAGAGLSLSGGAASLRRGRRLVAAGAALSLDGGSAVLCVGRRLVGQVSTLALSGGAARLLAGRVLVAAGASISFVGGMALLTYLPRQTTRRYRLVARGPAVTVITAKARTAGAVVRIVARPEVYRLSARVRARVQIRARRPDAE